MKAYRLTNLGKRIVHDRGGDTDELKVLDAVAEAGSVATDVDLEVVGDRHLLRSLVKRGYIKVVSLGG
ncbi:hypothetical protein LCGC14_0683560 [marine sediment metagenome]|uniref:Uncharacterized protein n=1 Tax=marine sediment metagenome TaxID=412755 RepID=A0A0F9QMJ7_9ZZZZ